jgi:putative hydrolase of the HAD superfamily
VRTLHWVVFDYGEVISQRTTALPDLAVALTGDAGTDAAAFERAYWAERDAYDRGSSDHDYWHAIGARLGVEVDQAKADELTKIDMDGWLRLDPATLALIEELGGRGIRLALLSNAPTSFGREVERQPWSGRFEHLVFSGDLGTAKPDAKIWTTLLDRLGASGPDCVFLDDRQVNVDGAIAAGLAAMLWAGADAARAGLTDLGLLDSR